MSAGKLLTLISGANVASGSGTEIRWVGKLTLTAIVFHRLVIGGYIGREPVAQSFQMAGRGVGGSDVSAVCHARRENPQIPLRPVQNRVLFPRALAINPSPV